MPDGNKNNIFQKFENITGCKLGFGLRILKTVSVDVKKIKK
jgi:hypothetical protein